MKVEPTFHQYLQWGPDMSGSTRRNFLKGAAEIRATALVSTHAPLGPDEHHGDRPGWVRHRLVARALAADAGARGDAIQPGAQGLRGSGLVFRCCLTNMDQDAFHEDHTPIELLSRQSGSTLPGLRGAQGVRPRFSLLSDEHGPGRVSRRPHANRAAFPPVRLHSPESLHVNHSIP